jgi:hypothetical protein
LRSLAQEVQLAWSPPRELVRRNSPAEVLQGVTGTGLRRRGRRPVLSRPVGKVWLGRVIGAREGWISFRVRLGTGNPHIGGARIREKPASVQVLHWFFPHSGPFRPRLLIRRSWVKLRRWACGAQGAPRPSPAAPRPPARVLARLGPLSGPLLEPHPAHCRKSLKDSDFRSYNFALFLRYNRGWVSFWIESGPS